MPTGLRRRFRKGLFIQFINTYTGSSATKHPNQRTILKLRFKNCFKN